MPRAALAAAPTQRRSGAAGAALTKYRNSNHGGRGRCPRTSTCGRQWCEGPYASALVLQGQMYGRASLTCDDASPGVPGDQAFLLDLAL